MMERLKVESSKVNIKGKHLTVNTDQGKILTILNLFYILFLF